MGSTKELKITVDDGSTRVPIVNKAGDEIGVFYFKPTDMNLIKRCNEIGPAIDDVAASLSKLEERVDGENTTEKTEEVLKDAEQKLCDLIDYLFDGNASEAFFGKTNPFSLINGEFYFQSVFDIVTDFITKQFNAEAKRMTNNVSKYTNKYEDKK